MRTIAVDNEFLELLNFGIRRYIGIAQTKYKLADSVKDPLKETIKKINGSLDGSAPISELLFDDKTFKIHQEAIRVSQQFSRDETEKAEMGRLYELFTGEKI